ncbi:MAG: hypothetical protein ABI210_00585, partial [Abditibacteriaceae bacterium]
FVIKCDSQSIFTGQIMRIQKTIQFETTKALRILLALGLLGSMSLAGCTQNPPDAPPPDQLPAPTGPKPEPQGGANIPSLGKTPAQK